MTPAVAAIMAGGFLLVTIEQAFIERARNRRHNADIDWRTERARLLAEENRKTEDKVREVRELLETRRSEAGLEQDRRNEDIGRLLGLNRAVLDNQREAAASTDARLDRVIARIAELEAHLRSRKTEE